MLGIKLAQATNRAPKAALASCRAVGRSGAVTNTSLKFLADFIVALAWWNVTIPPTPIKPDFAADRAHPILRSRRCQSALISNQKSIRTHCALGLSTSQLIFAR